MDDRTFIMIDKEQYEKIRVLAKANNRSIVMQLKTILDTIL